jgi:hypothetical protein
MNNNEQQTPPRTHWAVAATALVSLAAALIQLVGAARAGGCP